MNNFGLTLRRSFVAAKSSIIRHRSEIMLCVGIAGFISASVFSSVATLKAVDVLKERKKLLASIDEAASDPDFEDDYPAEDQKADTIKVNVFTGLNLAMLYAPAILATGLSIASLIISHKMQKDQLVALAAAYTVLNEQFQKYRLGVIDKYGKDVDKELYEKHAKSAMTSEELKSRLSAENINTNAVEVLFDENNSFCWKKNDPYGNYVFLKCHQEFFNHKLKSEKGVVFLNDVYDQLGFKRTKEGQFLGWKYDPNGANHIDFGFLNGEPGAQAFCDGKELNVWLKFNVDGIVIDNL